MTPNEIAKILVQKRKEACSLSQYPAAIPQNIDFSYQVQDEAIKLWGDNIIGWKIGRLAPELQQVHNTERLSGPIFESLVRHNNEIVEAKIFGNGFAAVEAEFVFRISKDTDPNKTNYSEEDAFALIDAVFAGVEMAGSPIQNINDLGPTVVASDFGNNFGLILGDKIIEFTNESQIEELSPNGTKKYTSKTTIENEIVGEGGLFSIPNGPLQAIAWLASHLALRGLPLKKGQLISSGATTGIHEIIVGKNAIVEFSKNGNIISKIVLNTKDLSK